MQHIQDIWSATEPLRNSNPPKKAEVGKLYQLQFTPTLELPYSSEISLYVYDYNGNITNETFVMEGDEVCLVVAKTKQEVHVLVNDKIIHLESEGFVCDVKVELIPIKEPCDESSQC